jgi:glycosyltransferase involved in cell wall biosynthesis
MPVTDLTVVVTTKNEERNLPRLLTSLANNGVAPDHVIVVDANSTDRTASIAADFGARVLIAAPNLSIQRNVGVREVRTPMAVILDADMEVPPGVFDEIAVLHDAGERCIILPERSVARSFLARARGFERSLQEGDLSIEGVRAFTTELFWEVGGYNEKVGFGGEDWLLSRIMYERCAPARTLTKILHHEGDPSVATILRKYFFYGRGRYRFFRANARYFMEVTNPIRQSTRRRFGEYVRRPVMAAGVIAYKTLTYGAGLAGFCAEALGAKRL